MSEERPKFKIVLIDSDAALFICLFLLMILCAGDPDLLDAIIKRVGNYPEKPKVEQIEKEGDKK